LFIQPSRTEISVNITHTVVTGRHSYLDTTGKNIATTFPLYKSKYIAFILDFLHLISGSFHD